MDARGWRSASLEGLGKKTRLGLEVGAFSGVRSGVGDKREAARPRVPRSELTNPLSFLNLSAPSCYQEVIFFRR
jgi:hypothetical protein